MHIRDSLALALAEEKELGAGEAWTRAEPGHHRHTPAARASTHSKAATACLESMEAARGAGGGEGQRK